MALRNVTQAEAKQWIELARKHGHVHEEGGIALGRFIVETDSAPGTVRLRFATPLAAGHFSGATLEKKTPPIMFDRSPAGEIIIPGRWWQSMFERFSELEGEDVPSDAKATAARAARAVRVDDILMPAETDTIAFRAPDEDGNEVVHEARPPGVVITLRMRRL
jgi:hypothetical protein